MKVSKISRYLCQQNVTEPLFKLSYSWFWSVKMKPRNSENNALKFVLILYWTRESESWNYLLQSSKASSSTLYKLHPWIIIVSFHAPLTSLRTKPSIRQQWQRSTDNRPKPRTHKHAAMRSASDSRRSLQTPLMTKIHYRCYVSRMPTTFYCLETRLLGIHTCLIRTRAWSWQADDRRSSKHTCLNCNPDLCCLTRRKARNSYSKYWIKSLCCLYYNLL